MSSPGRGGGSLKVVIAALSGNAAIAVAKLVAAGLSGSVAMLAEAVHSLADTGNQGLLLLGMRLSKKRDPERYPFGRAGEVYFWAFLVSLMLFFLGGVYAIYEGVEKIASGAHTERSAWPALIVLIVSLFFEGTTFTIALRHFKAAHPGRAVRRTVFDVKDPTVSVVLLEDSAAIVGLLLALGAVLISWRTGSPVPDGIGSILVGVLLCSVGIALGRDTHSLLIGESASPEVRRRALAIVRGTDGVEEVTQLVTLHLGPDTVLLALKVRFRPDLSVEQVEDVTNAVEERVRAELPQMKKIFVEADSEYDAALDRDAVP